VDARTVALVREPQHCGRPSHASLTRDVPSVYVY
jgi:hypothetical protein